MLIKKHENLQMKMLAHIFLSFVRVFGRVEKWPHFVYSTIYCENGVKMRRYRLVGRRFHSVILMKWMALSFLHTYIKVGC